MMKKQMTIKLIITAAGLLLGSYASAANVTHIFDNGGGGGNVWEDPTNWNLGDLPAFSPDPDNSTVQLNADVTLSSASTIRRVVETLGGQTLTIANSGNLRTRGNYDFYAGGANVTIQNGGLYNNDNSRIEWRAGAGTLRIDAGGEHYSRAVGWFLDGTLDVAGNASFRELRTATTGTTFGPSSAEIAMNGGTLTVRNYMEWDGASVFTVGNGSTLSLANNNHTFTDGLTIANTGTLGSGNNAATPATSITGGALTLESGAIIDFSINGNTKVSDTWALNGGLSLTSFETYNLVVDAVAGSIGLTDGDGGDGLSGEWDIFTWGSNGPTQAVFDDTTWIVSATANTRIGAPGLVEYEDLGGGAGRIYLTNFSAFAIPEPSTAMLLGMGGMVMYFRRRLR